MRIAFVFDSLGMGGIERVGVDYANMLSNECNKISVYNLHPTENLMVKQLSKDITYIERKFDRKWCPDLYSYGVMKWWWGKYLYPSIHFILKGLLILRRLFTHKENYDVAIAFSGHMNDLTYVAERFVKANKRIVWCHGTLLSYLAICDGYTNLYKNIDSIVTLSDLGEFSVYAGRKFLHDKKIYKQYNPSFIQYREVNTELANNLKDNYGDFILMIARATPQKDHFTAIKAVEELKKRGIEKNIIFLGDGDMLNSIKKFANDQGVAKQCIFKGNVLNTQDYLSACYIGLLASNFEGLPTVIIETMAFGKPCIMTNSDGGEVSGFGKYCYLAPVGDPITIADALEELYTDKAKYEEYSKLSLERFKYFNPEVVLNGVLKIINTC